MKLIDVNVLLYAYDREAPQHGACSAWLEAAFNSEELVALPWLTLLAFLRITTNSKAYKRPLQTTEACDIVSSWIAQAQRQGHRGW